MNAAPVLCELEELEKGDTIRGIRNPDGSDGFFDYGATMTLKYRPTPPGGANFWRLVPGRVTPGNVVIGTLYVPDGSKAWRMPS